MSASPGSSASCIRRHQTRIHGYLQTPRARATGGSCCRTP
ncbi:MAG: hypothetical protein EOP50_07715 [Sphingobacteriales bacterium]|nr:MAG: hypothetical protein EOP50_07715 [Sphingobacteriales bacterium]